MEKIYESLDYSDNNLRKAWEKKWDVLQMLWTIYIERNKPDDFYVPVNKLTIKERSVDTIDGILDGFKKEGCFDWARPSQTYEIKNINHNKFSEVHQITGLIYHRLVSVQEKMAGGKNKETQSEPTREGSLKSIHLLVRSVAEKNTIFLVLDRMFDDPIRCVMRNRYGEASSIKMLFDMACPWNVVGKDVPYSKDLARNMNNGLFRKRRVQKYMKTNRFKKPTLLEKSDQKTLVLKNNLIKVGLVEHDVPLQDQKLYR